MGKAHSSYEQDLLRVRAGPAPRTGKARSPYGHPAQKGPGPACPPCELPVSAGPAPRTGPLPVQARHRHPVWEGPASRHGPLLVRAGRVSRMSTVWAPCMGRARTPYGRARSPYRQGRARPTPRRMDRVRSLRQGPRPVRAGPAPRSDRDRSPYRQSPLPVPERS
jgi:hypothetical protein